MQSRTATIQKKRVPSTGLCGDDPKTPLVITVLFWLAFQTFLAAQLEPILMFLSGKCATFYRGSELYWEPAGYWVLPLADFDLRVTTACSGVSFFGMLCTLALWLFLTEKQYRRSLLPLVTIPLYALGFTILLNAIRIHLAGETFYWFQQVLSEGWQTRAHLTLGIIIFLPALILWFSLLTKKWTTHE